MIEPVPSVAPVVLRPAVSSDDAGRPEPSDRQVGSKAWARRGRRCLSALLGLLRRLPSIEDTRKIVVNTLTIAAAVLALVVIVKTALKPATVIDAIGVPKELEERGYTSAVVAQRLIDEITQIGAIASTLKDHATFSSLPFENKVPKIDLPVAGMSLATVVSQFRELVGITDTRISGEVIAERASNAGVGEKDGQKSPVTLSLRLRILDSGTIHAGEPATKLDLLLRPAALQVVERFDPYIAASYYYVSDDFENAQRMVQRLRDTGVEEERRLAINLSGLIALSQKRYDDALAVFTSLIERDGHSVGPRLNRATVRIAMGRAEQTSDAARRSHFEYALADALQAVVLTDAYAPAKSQKQKREIALAHTAAGEALFRMGDGAKLDEAIAHLKRAVEAYPNYGRAYLLQSQIHRARNDRDQAIAMLSRAADVDPNNPDIYDVYTSWGELLREMGRTQEARKIFERAIAANPRNPNGYSFIGKIYLAQRDWDKAAEYFRKAIEANPSWAWFHYNLARALAGAGRLDQSIAAVRKATALDPQHAPSYAEWGRALAESARQKNGKIVAELKKDAATKLAKAVELAPRDGEVLKDVGKSYELLNQPAPALEAYLAALAAGDTDEGLLAEIAKLRRAAR